ncbi:uncharacterized protein A1O9_07054 [Exophiala aquamarina CBS 119918]|uniref:Uncharacterized protein n=1 Tax=Exophiala aquamarina CBS 119918 TaxID=1182545 RepID=A0A072P9T1_9EURO|nr:uncharacterized protein A1O9_07054 [Exophiala aquamarina CBS 119918]KEF56864.1 hypothetical protein A1O9_07054 [Exophiala aquamarina CBS 119918]
METLGHQDHHNHHSDIFPNKMAVIRLNNTDLDDDLVSDAGTVEAHRSSGLTRSASLRSYRRQSSLLKSSASRLESKSYAKHSAELTAQAESKFLILMDVISNASKEASSLKAVWENMKHERELLLQRHEEMVNQTTELTAELRAREDERSRSSTDVVDWKRKVEKLLTDLAAAHRSVTAEKAHVQERDKDIERIRTELREVRDSGFRKDSQNERELEHLRARLKQTESDRDAITQASEKYHRDLNKACRERSELASKLNEITTSHEISQKDVLSLTGRLKIVEAERETSLQTIVRLKEEVKRAKQKSSEDSRDAIEAIEKFEKAARESARVKETLGVIEVERDDHLRTIETLRRQSKAQKLDYDDLATRFADVSRDHEATRREIITLQENLKTSEVSRDKYLQTLERTRESLHSITRQRDELTDEMSTIAKRLDEQKQQSVLARESLSNAEEKISELQVEITTMKEKIVHAQRERDDAFNKGNRHLTEIDQLRERITALEHQKRDVVDSRTKLSSELEQLRSEYSQITETMTSFHDDSEDMEQEIENLRALVHEAQEQRERAVSARESADRERDTYISRYDDKCRELERLREGMLSRSGSYSHAHSRRSGGGGEFRTTRTITSRSVSQLDHGTSHENGFSNSSGIEHTSHMENPTETLRETSVAA